MPTLALLLLTACKAPEFDEQVDSNDGDEQTSTSESDPHQETDDGATGCAWEPTSGSSALGTPCNENTDCESGVCEVYQTFNPEDAGICGEAPRDCRTRIMATVWDLLTQEAVAGAAIRMVAAPDALSGPENATALLETETDALGHVDTTSPAQLDAAYALLGLVEQAGRMPTANGAGAPDAMGVYGPCLRERDWWSIATADIDAWNESLAQDPLVAPYLPLESGFVVGVVRRAEHPSSPIAGVSIASETPDTSNAIVRYLEVDGMTFNDVATTDTGLFLLLGVATGERFTVESEGFVPTYPDNLRAASFSQLAYMMKIWMTPAP